MQELSNVDTFMKSIMEGLTALGISVAPYECDHLCYRCGSEEEYLSFCQKMKEEGHELLIESMIGGRPISTFKFLNPLQFENFKISCLEVPSPKKGSFYQSGLEHAEFVIGEISLQTLMEKFPQVQFDTRAFHKKVNPDVSVRLKSGEQVKFHQQPLYRVIEEEKNHGFEAVPHGYFLKSA